MNKITLPTVDDLEARLYEIGMKPQRGEALCPAHDDNRKSLSYGPGEERPWVVHCFAGCRQEDVLAVLYGDRMPVERSGASPKKRRRGRRRSYGPVTWYDYVDEDGQLLYQHGRTPEKEFPFRMPGGDWGLADGVRRVLYRLDELAAAQAGAVAFVVEGEKDADRLAAEGLLATCNDNGAGKWREEFAEAFADLYVAILPDNDDAGRQHAELVARNISETAAGVKVVELPGLPEKGDVFDWLDEGHDAGELQAAVVDAEWWEPALTYNGYKSEGPPSVNGSQREAPALASERELRALWWARHVGRLDEIPAALASVYRRRVAGLEAAENPLVRDAYAAVQAEEQPADELVGLLLQQVDEWAGPQHLQQLLERPSNAAELLEGATGKEAVMVMPELSPGSGEWPGKPHHRGHEDETGAVITMRANETAVARMITPNWRDTEERPGCPACQYDRAQRQARQVLHERHRQDGRLWLLELPTGGAFVTFRDRLRKRRQRGDDAIYRAYPLPGGAYVVIHNQEKEGGRPVPDDRGRLFRMLHEPANSTPDGKLISSSQGWGGPWQGTQGDGRVKAAEAKGEDAAACLQLWTHSSVADVAGALGVKLRPKEKAFSVAMRRLQAYERLASAGIELKERRTNRNALRAVLEAEGLDVTHLTHQAGEEKPLFKMCDKQGATGPDRGQATAPRPLSPALFGAES